MVKLKECSKLWNSTFEPTVITDKIIGMNSYQPRNLRVAIANWPFMANFGFNPRTFADKNRIVGPNHQCRDLVWLSNKNTKTTRPLKNHET